MLAVFIWTQISEEVLTSKEINKIRPSITLPRVEDQVFVGREEELNQIMSNLTSSIRIISITGSPGFGKSSLAIHAGYSLEKLGITVYYVDLSQVLDMEMLKETIKEAISMEHEHYLNISRWLKQLTTKSLLIMDNCDLILHEQKDDTQNFLKVMIKQSSHLRIVLTAQQITFFNGPFWQLSVKELSLEDAMVVLRRIYPQVTFDFAEKLAKLVGEVPLALQVVGTLLKEQATEALYHALKQDLIRTLSPEELPSDERVATVLNISYHYLDFRFQVCGRVLANFLGSFHSDVAHYVLEHFGKSLPGPWKLEDTEKCLDILRRRSLLSVNRQRRIYSFHQLIRNFFQLNQEKEDEHPKMTSLFKSIHVNITLVLFLPCIGVFYKLQKNQRQHTGNI